MKRKKNIKKLADLLPGAVGVLVFVVLCISFFMVFEESQSVYLHLSVDQPWGILTSTYIHADVEHLQNNMLELFLFSFMLLIINVWVPGRIKKAISSTLIALLFLTGPIVGSIEYLIWLLTGSFDVSSCGSSDVVYAVSALTLISFGLNIPLFWRISSGRRKSRRAAFLFIAGVFIIFLFFSSLIHSPEIFFGVSPGVDVWAHILGFLVGLLVSLRLLLPVYRKFI